MLDLTYETPKPKVIAGATGDWELVIGLEVHAQVASKAKLFSGASTTFGAEPNSNVAFVDAAMPGMLPVINEFCVEQAVRTGLGLKAEINLTSAFDRKNYFYPDLPQGYQISQLYHPIVGEGEILVDMGPGVARLVRVERIHLEQDAGKSIHDMDPHMSFVDLNRTGVALMEIVSRPDIRGPEEAAAYVVKLRQILRYLGTCDGNMQNGNLRADVNVSVCRPGDYEKYQETQDFSHLGTRCEIKNMNSMRFIQQAIDVEAKRQIALLEDGKEVVQETRLYDPDKGETRSMRSKEEAHDYRYFPCPDLLPLEIEQAWVDEIEASLPELPDAIGRYVASRPQHQPPYWDIERARQPGTRNVVVELVVNGSVAGNRQVVADGAWRDVQFDLAVARSSWVAVRVSHAAPSAASKKKAEPAPRVQSW